MQRLSFRRWRLIRVWNDGAFYSRSATDAYSFRRTGDGTLSLKIEEKGLSLFVTSNQRIGTRQFDLCGLSCHICS